MAFLDDDFLLTTPTARRLFHEVARDLPIVDYHCHLPPEQVAANCQFETLTDIWLAGDHYKWRLMRANGVPESHCTGEADPYDKWLAFARTIPMTLRNPMYHWCHLELRRYFGIDALISEDTAKEIWDGVNAQLPGLKAHDILQKFKVAVVCTTDDPTDPLEQHKAIAAHNASGALATRVYPTYRPDKALNVDQAREWNGWVSQLEAVSGVKCDSFATFTTALKERHDSFHEIGGRLSDHGMEQCYADFCDESTASAIFDKARAGQDASQEEKRQFASFLMVYFGVLDFHRGWTKQLHLGAMRNTNTRLFKKLGPDVGGDSVGDFPQGRTLARYLDTLELGGNLPKIVLYNLNPVDNYLFASMIGNFQDSEGKIPGKVQFGSGWWFNDQLEGMRWQMNALSNLGLLSRFVGMLTDSRSFLSYCRHEYFRRLLCQMVGSDVDNGLIPDVPSLYEPLVANVCYHNAARHFGFEVPEVS
ncbi:MAG: glucuronate isomerase [Opitutales bacterium]